MYYCGIIVTAVLHPLSPFFVRVRYRKKVRTPRGREFNLTLDFRVLGRLVQIIIPETSIPVCQLYNALILGAFEFSDTCPDTNVNSAVSGAFTRIPSTFNPKPDAEMMAIACVLLPAASAS